ncbi:MAG: FecR family protein [Planctomycetota bacterium]
MSKLTPNQRECVGLISNLIEGTLTDEQRDRFNSFCREDPVCRKIYLAEIAIHGTLLWSCEFSTQRDADTDDSDAFLREVYEEARINRIKLDAEIALAKNLQAQAEEKKKQRQFNRDSGFTPPRTFVIPKLAVYGGLAAAVLLAVVLLWPLTQSSTPARSLTADPPVVAIDPEVVPQAEIIRTERAVWERTVPSDGVLRGKGLWTLQEGFAEITMPSGASILLQGPTRFRLMDDNQIVLEQGRLAAEVPDRAKYFTVKTKSMDVVDLGTRFGVTVDRDGLASASVFEGKVEVHESKPTAAGSLRTIELAAGQQVTADVTGKLADFITEIQPDHGYVYRWESIQRYVETQGQARFFDSQPKSVRQDTFQNTQYMVIFPESQMTLEQPLRAWSELPEREMPKPTTIPAGRRVMSFFIHYAPETIDQAGNVTATLKFPGKILGVVGNVNGLRNTNEKFGLPSVEYMPADLQTTYAIDAGSPDYFSIGGQRGEVLKIHLAAGAFADQARVIVELPALSKGTDQG